MGRVEEKTRVPTAQRLVRARIFPLDVKSTSAIPATIALPSVPSSVWNLFFFEVFTFTTITSSNELSILLFNIRHVRLLQKGIISQDVNDERWIQMAIMVMIVTKAVSLTLSHRLESRFNKIKLWNRAILYVYTPSSELVYQEKLLDRCSSITAMHNDSNTKSLLVGCTNNVLKFDVAKSN
jgi:hypothetical protein